MGLLIVEDEPEISEIVAEIALAEKLFEPGRIWRAENGRQGIELYDQHQPDIVVTDMVLPLLRGPEVIQEIRSRGRDTEIIVMTAHADLDSAISLFQYNVVEFVRKPFNFREMGLVLRKAKERFDLRQQNEEFRRKLVQSEKFSSLGLLASGIAHEINNPNTFVKGNLELILKYFEVIQPLVSRAASEAGPDQAKFTLVQENLVKTAQAAVTGCERIRTIVSALLSLARTEGGEKQTVRMSELIEEALSLTQYRLKRAKVVKEGLEGLRPVCVNSQEILQVLMNLIVNAADAGSGRIRIVGREDPGAACQWIEVEDDGCGIAPEIQGRIFDPFFTTKSVGQGTGLGLSISRGNVESNGGTLSFRTTPGKGSVFSVRLPLQA